MANNLLKISFDKPQSVLQAISILLIASTISSHADLLVYEGFDYPAGPLVGQSGGKGWNEPWHGWPGDTDPNHAGAVAVASLKPAQAIASTGGHMETPDPDTPLLRTLKHPVLDAAGVTWVALIVRNDSGGTDGTYSHWTLSSSQEKEGANVVSIGKEYNGQNWAITVGGQSHDLSVPADNTAVLIVVRLEHSTTAGADSVRAFVNPSTAAEPTTPTLKVDGLTLKPADLVTIRSGSGKKIFCYDEIRIGTAFADVVPPVDSDSK